MGALDDLRASFRALTRAPAQPPIWAPIPAEQTDFTAFGQRIVPDGDYFQVRLLRIQLAHQSHWFQKFAPLALVAVDFSYDGKEVTRPSVVGPAMIEKMGGEVPVATTIAGTVVAGPHPLRPGGLDVSVALYQIPQGNLLAPFMDAVEGAASALDLAAGVVPFTALAKVVLHGVQALAAGSNALIARRDHFPALTSGCFALIAPTTQVDTRALCIRSGELMELVDGQLAPFRRADSALYSIERVELGDVDVGRLPLHRQWVSVLNEANKANTPEGWTSTKAQLSTLIAMAFASPDLTWGHAERLEQEWTAKAVSRRDAARRRGDMGGERTSMDEIRTRALAALDL